MNWQRLTSHEKRMTGKEIKMSKLASQSPSTTPTPSSLASNPILFSVIPCYSFSQPNGCRCGIKGIKSAGCRDKSLAQ
jgi:hypothetical protein